MSEEETANQVGATRTTLGVLEGLEELGGATVTGLATHLDAPKSTVHNHLSTLLDAGYVVREGDTFHLGLRFTELGEQSRNRHPVYAVGSEEVRALADTTGELVNLAVEENGEVVYIDRASGENAVSTDTFAGKRVSMHCTSLGKAMLAHMPDERVREVVQTHGLPARTEHTLTTPAALFEELETIRERGVAFDDEERGHGIRCVAAAILQREEQRVVGAVSISGPTSRLQGELFREELPETLRSAVNVVEIELTYSGQFSGQRSV